jgi:hypothetical protein
MNNTPTSFIPVSNIYDCALVAMPEAREDRRAAIFIDGRMWLVLEHLRVAIRDMESHEDLWVDTQYVQPDNYDSEVTRKLTRAISFVDAAQWQYVLRSTLRKALMLLLDATRGSGATFTMIRMHPHSQAVVDMLLHGQMRHMLMNPQWYYYSFRYPEDGTRQDLNNMHKSDFTHTGRADDWRHRGCLHIDSCMTNLGAVCTPLGAPELATFLSLAPDQLHTHENGRLRGLLQQLRLGTGAAGSSGAAAAGHSTP